MLKRFGKLPPPDIDDWVALADWVEATVLLSEVSYASRADLRTLVALSCDVDPDESEQTVEFLLKEIERRHALAPGTYPFIVDGSGVSISLSVADGARVAYVFLLVATVSPRMGTQAALRRAEPLFDRLVLDALKAYLGVHSEGVRFGTPVSDGRPTRFLSALEWLSSHLGCDLGIASRKPPKRNDGGADVIVWRPFRDKRTGFVTILGQCTLQRQWRNKAKDIVVDLWRGWIDFGKSPATCLAIPFVVPREFEKWDEVRRTVVVVLDRMRIMDLLDGVAPQRLKELSDWLKSELSALAA